MRPAPFDSWAFSWAILLLAKKTTVQHLAEAIAKGWVRRWKPPVKA